MQKEAQKVLDERKLIDTKLKSVRDSFNGGIYDNSFDIANELLAMNLTAEERKEVETIKSTSEKKIAEERAAAEKAAKEARQNMINSAIKITSTKLYEEFTTNKVGAEAKYKDKILLVTGTIYKIDDTWIFDDPYIELQTGYVADGVIAYFSKDNNSQLIDLHQGQTIKILGRCGGISLGFVKLYDCSIVN